jgi:hypothetical protein
MQASQILDPETKKWKGIAPYSILKPTCHTCESRHVTHSRHLIERTVQPDINDADKDSKTKPLDWSWLPVAYCINLKSRSDRRESAMKEFHRVGLCQKVIFYQTERDKNGGMRGCWESHRSIAKKAVSDGVDWYLLFEDDVVFVSGFNQTHIDKIKDALDNLPPKWNFFFLGGLPRLLLPVTLKHAYVKYSGWLLHAGFYSRHIAQALSGHSFDIFNKDIKDKSQYLEVDHWYAKDFGNSYLNFPPVAFMNEKLESDLINDRMPFFKKLQQNYSTGLNQTYCWLNLLWPFIYFVFFLLSIMVLVFLFILQNAKYQVEYMSHRHHSQTYDNRQSYYV